MTLLETLTKITSDKKAKGLFPTHIMIDEIDYTNIEVRKEIARLQSDGKIRIGVSINSHFIEIL